MHPEPYAALVHQVARRRTPLTLAQVRRAIAAWIAQSNNERSRTMLTSDPLPTLTDHDRRWMVHVFAALREGIRDELKLEELPFHDDSLVDDWDRYNHLYSYVYASLTWCMEQTHADEAAVVAAEIAASRATYTPFDAD
jgi:hypothetical protein